MTRTQRPTLAFFAITPALLAACGTSVSTTALGDGGIKGSLPDSGIHLGGDAAPVNPCTNGSSTTVSGKIYDPAGNNPLYGVAVYLTTATSLPPLSSGASCAPCDSLYAGVPIVTSAVTDATGSFQLKNAPSGSNVSLVAQVGKWRRLFPISVTACQDNPQGDGTLTLPKNGREGDIPEIAVSTGAFDTLECMLGRIGLDQSEYVGGPDAGGTDGGVAGHIHIFQGSGPTSVPVVPQVPGSTATSASDLWDQSSDLMPYDLVLLSCEGEYVTRTATEMQALVDYTSAGGRVFMSHFHYDWLNEGPFAADNLAQWSSSGLEGFAATGEIVTQLNNGQPFIKGQALKQWLLSVDALVNDELPVVSPQYNAVVTPANAVSQPWVAAPNPKDNTQSATLYFSFDTPIDTVGDAAVLEDGGNWNYCGRVVFSDLHVSADTTVAAIEPPCGDYWKEQFGGCFPTNRAVPSGCVSGGLSPQEKALEFMLFDLSSCVVPDTQAPPPPPSIPQ